MALDAHRVARESASPERVAKKHFKAYKDIIEERP